MAASGTSASAGTGTRRRISWSISTDSSLVRARRAGGMWEKSRVSAASRAAAVAVRAVSSMPLVWMKPGFAKISAAPWRASSAARAALVRNVRSVARGLDVSGRARGSRSAADAAGASARHIASAERTATRTRVAARRRQAAITSQPTPSALKVSRVPVPDATTHSGRPPGAT